MKYLLLLLLVGCTPERLPNCPAPDPNDKPGIFATTLGSVQIDNETCTIIETNEKYNCKEINWNPSNNTICQGKTYQCQSKTLTRITKCPSEIYSNSINRTGGKFPREKIE